jgi:predicted acylesterase/phospholipase RssA
MGVASSRVAGRTPAYPLAEAEFGAHRDRILVLKGGGALGAYQAGVYEQLASAGFAPNWLADVSIGVINAQFWRAGHEDIRRVIAAPNARRVSDFGNGIHVFEL